MVVYPDGVQASWNAGACCGVAWNDSVDDVAFTKALLAELECAVLHRSEPACTRPANCRARRLPSAHRVGCEMASTFAAIAPVAGVLGIDAGACLPSRPMPVLDFHGTADPLVPYDGGAAASGLGGTAIVFQSVAETIATWVARDDCNPPAA